METVELNGIVCIKKLVENTQIYETLINTKINGIPQVLKIDGNYIYYEYIEAFTLREVIQRSDVLHTNPKQFIYLIAYEIINILKALQQVSIIHKDLKPENILITQDKKVYLIDFDVSRFETEKEYDTTLFGTRGYASPEHFGYSNTTFKSDMFSLGKVLEELDYYNNFTAIINKCIQIDPRNRYESYNKLLEELDKFRPITSIKKLYLNPRFLIPYSILYTFLFLISIINPTEGDNLATTIVLSIYIPFLACDGIDYYRISKYYKKDEKKITKVKKRVTISTFVITIVLLMIFDL